VFSHDKADRVSGLIKKKFSTGSVLGINDDITRTEIRKVLFSMSENKAPGLDGFSAPFFHSAWPIIGDNVCEAVLEFFHHGKLLQEVNSTIITLVSKRKNLSSMGDYWPIFCCNIIYKCITKFWLTR
jgi:hypothetical protein